MAVPYFSIDESFLSEKWPTLFNIVVVISAYKNLSQDIIIDQFSAVRIFATHSTKLLPS